MLLTSVEFTFTAANILMLIYKPISNLHVLSTQKPLACGINVYRKLMMHIILNKHKDNHNHCVFRVILWVIKQET